MFGPAHGAQSVRRISADDQARAGAPGVSVCLTRLFGRSDSSPEQENQKDDQQDQAEATAIVMVWGSIIEAAAAKQKIKIIKRIISPIDPIPRDVPAITPTINSRAAYGKRYHRQ